VPESTSLLNSASPKDDRMTRSKIADLSEIVSSIAIVATLIYLTVQVRQNTEALQSQTRQAVLAASQAELNMLIEHPAISLAIVATDRPLSTEENVTVDAWLSSALRSREFAWLQYGAGSVDEQQWATEESVLVSIFDNPLPRLWWERIGRFVTGPEFAAYVGNLIAATPPTGQLWSTTWSLPDSIY
jgi:hypothetical protein